MLAVARDNGFVRQQPMIDWILRVIVTDDQFQSAGQTLCRGLLCITASCWGAEFGSGLSWEVIDCTVSTRLDGYLRNCMNTSFSRCWSLGGWLYVGAWPLCRGFYAGWLPWVDDLVLWGAATLLAWIDHLLKGLTLCTILMPCELDVSAIEVLNNR